MNAIILDDALRISATDPCRLVRQVNEIEKLTQGPPTLQDPCRLVRQVNEIGELTQRLPILQDPCRLVRQVNQTESCQQRQSSSPAGQAGRGRRAADGCFRLATNLVHLPGKLAGVALLGLLFAGCSTRGTNDAPNEPPDRPAVETGLKKIATKTGIEMVLVPAGKFTMGDERGEDDEKPAHEVELSAFYIDTCEVTQAAYEALMGRNPAKFPGPDQPVERVSWHAAMQYCNMRSLREGLKPCYDPKTQQCDFAANGYRLPTEAEWEYACRAGSRTQWSFGDNVADLEKHAWTKDNAAKTTHPVKAKAPNGWGLYDMHGNVAEWCTDFYAESYSANGTKDPRGPEQGEERVLRGGSWNVGGDASRSSARRSETPGLADVCFGYEAYGFRCVRRVEAIAARD